MITDRRGRPNSRMYALPPAWEDAVAGWSGWLELSGMSPASITQRRQHVRALARRSQTGRPADLTLGDLVRLCSGQKWSNEYRRSMRVSLVSFFDWCLRNGAAKSNPATQLPTVRYHTGRPRPATEDVWRHLMATTGPRERLMVRLAGEAGLRRAEIARCHRDDLIDDPRGSCLIVHGTANKQRVVPISDSLAEAFRSHCATGYLFPGQVDGHLSPRYVGGLIGHIMPPGFTMHTLRDRFATRAYRGTRNLRAVQILLGHASIAATERYAAVDDSEIRAAMAAAQ